MSPESLLQERKADFIRKRTINEQNVNAYLKRAFDMRDKEPGWFSTVTFPIGRTAQEVLPSMYKEVFDEEQFKKEVKALSDFDAALQQVGAALNAEAERRLSQQ